jgi:predicted peptidase
MLALFGLLAGALFARAADKPAPTGFLDRTYDSFKYVVFIPKDYNADKAYPLILFLHGAGERGTDGKRQSEVGLGKAVKKHADTFPFIVVFPQAQKTWKVGSDDSKRALAILDQVEKDYKVDKKRVYLTGLSMGGYGTWDLAAADPKRWAAIVPICGGGDPKAANRF